ncbi:hypothetical protein CCY99_07480 [Helicobacter sp. 16-1353]|uniref:hypothetical protein n=1 Tax=Helicobacter sp. 16-1353 TaxID=2004996 RepID=UPI000DCAF1ED|nr:hypothetical protein [Helicobacter sp. 16-1353]RAX52478.1 hypothetical protein CCY99_07480 [Helicobacter sp. 16-1353]
MRFLHIFFIIIAFQITSFACSGDCTTCHFNVDYNDKNHSVMLNCKVCHTDEKLAKLQMQSSCGQDCFACHSVEKINMVKNEEHIALTNCISCHISLKSTLQDKLNNNINPLFNNKIFNKNR